MSRVFTLPFALAFAALLFPAAARAQEAGAAGAECPGPVFKGGSVARKARIFSKPEPGFTDEARKHNVSGVVRLTAVLCRTGQVTDIKVVEGLPYGMTEKVIEAARRMKFAPALKNRRRVSQLVNLEYNFRLFGGSVGEGPEGWAKYGGRLVEEVVVEGNRRLIDREVLGYVRTRPGDRYDAAQVRRDLQTLLDLRLFDTRQTRVGIETGPRGGVVVIFQVAELPIIRGITFEGLKSVSADELKRALRASRTGIHQEAPYDAARVTAAKRVIREMLAARGFEGAEVEVRVDELSALSVTLRFIIKEGRGGRWF